MEKKEEIAGAEPIRLVDLIDYQRDAIVSRTLIDKPEGTLTCFAFDKDQGLSEHTAPFDAIVYIIEGEAEITISGRTQRVITGEMIIMPAHEPHALRAVERFKMVLTMIKA
jgi:quercetin dioxygenase-like cupin family protein